MSRQKMKGEVMDLLNISSAAEAAGVSAKMVRHCLGTQKNPLNT